MDVLHGCLGGLSFGMYHAYITHLQMIEHDKKFQKKFEVYRVSIN